MAFLYNGNYFSDSVVSTPPSIVTTTKLVICNLNGENNKPGMDFPPVFPGQYSKVNCSNGKGVIKWLCLNDGTFDGEMPDESECWVNDIIDKVENINSTEEVHQILDIIYNGTQTDSSITSSVELNNVIEIVGKFQNYVNNLNETDLDLATNLTTGFINVFNNLIDQNKAWNNANENQKTDMASKVLLNIQFSAFILSCNLNETNNKQEVSTNNIIIETYFTDFKEQTDFKVNETSITIPKDLSIDRTDGCNNSSIGSLVEKLDIYLLKGLDTKQIIYSKIIGFSVSNDNKTHQINNNLKVRIRLENKHRLEFGDEIKCVYWDFSQNEWSLDGCEFVVKDSDRYITVCECNHLSNFAALMDYSLRDDSILDNLLTDICCGVSILFMILTILLVLIPKNNNNMTFTEKLKDRRNLITYNLCLSLIVSNIIIIFGMDYIEIEPIFICSGIAGLLLYSLLCSFTWMIIEGLHIYRKLGHVIISTSTIKCSLFIGYGIPLIIIGLSYLIIYYTEDYLLFDIRESDNFYFCWISSNNHPKHIWIFVVPVMFTIVFNSYVLIVLMIKVYKMNARKQITTKLMSKLKQMLSFFLLTINLGITWFLFVFYAHLHITYVSEVFIVLNGLQGFFIFVYQSLLFNSLKSKYKIRERSTTENSMIHT